MRFESTTTSVRVQPSVDLFQARVRTAGAHSTAVPAEPVAGVRTSPPSEQARREDGEQRRAAARAGLGAHAVLYAAVVLLLLALWLVDGLLADGEWDDPWPLWPALGLGVPLAGQIWTALRPVRRP